MTHVPLVKGFLSIKKIMKENEIVLFSQMAAFDVMDHGMPCAFCTRDLSGDEKERVSPPMLYECSPPCMSLRKVSQLASCDLPQVS